MLGFTSKGLCDLVLEDVFFCGIIVLETAGFLLQGVTQADN